MSTIYHMDAAALFRGDNPEGHFLDLKNVKLPMLEEIQQEHQGAGAGMSIELPMAMMNTLSVPFSLKGIDPSVIGDFMHTERRRYTIRGNIHDLKTQQDIGLRAVIEGRMTKADPGQFERSSGVDADYEIKNIVLYQLFMSTSTTAKYDFDFFAGLDGVKIDGRAVFGAKARNLGLI